MTFRVPPFGTLGTAQYGDTEEPYIEARKAHNPWRCRRLTYSSIEPWHVGFKETWHKESLSSSQLYLETDSYLRPGHLYKARRGDRGDSRNPSYIHLTIAIAL